MTFNKCSLCDKKRVDDFDRPKWKSDIRMEWYIETFKNKESSIFKKEFTLCPDCRKKPLIDIILELQKKER